MATLADGASIKGRNDRSKLKEADEALRTLAGAAGGPATEAATVLADTLQVGLAALAKVIEDRAKREAIGWFLQQVGQDLCYHDDDATLKVSESDTAEVKQRKLVMASLRRELTGYWFPTLCKLAGSDNDLTQYGAGAKLLEALRSALAKDVRSWPGVAVGLGLGVTFWESAHQTTNPLDCPIEAAPAAGDSRSEACDALREIRKAGAAFMDAIISGQAATTALSALSVRVDGANHKPKMAGLYSDGFQVAACVAALPLFFDQHGDLLASGMDHAERTEAILVGGLASTPACWAIVGKGVPKTGDSACDELNPEVRRAAPVTCSRKAPSFASSRPRSAWRGPRWTWAG